MSVPFKTLCSSALRYVTLWSTKTIKSVLKICFPIRGINFRTQHLTCSPIYHRVTIHHDIFFGDRTKRVSLTYHPSAFDHKLFFDDFRSSSIHVIQKGISALKIISFYLVMVSLMAFSSSFFVFIQSRRGMFNSFAFSNNDVLFIYYYFVTLG